MKRILIGLYLAFSLWITGVILFRRLAWNQIPTQLPAGLVYATVVANILVAVWLIRRLRRS